MLALSIKLKLTQSIYFSVNSALLLLSCPCTHNFLEDHSIQLPFPLPHKPLPVKFLSPFKSYYVALNNRKKRL